MLKKIRDMRVSVREGLLAGTEVAGLVASLAGTSVAIVFGKLMLAVVLGFFAAGVFLRLTGRRARQEQKATISSPAWVKVVAGLLALAFTALLVEMTALPVRFDQAGFSYLHWVLVCACSALTFHWLAKLLVRLVRWYGQTPGASLR